MSMIGAFRFLGKCRSDGDFRKTLYEGSGPAGFRGIVLAEGFEFNDEEFADALRSLELRAVDEYEAEEIKELGQWYRLMAGVPVPSCSSCASRRVAVTP